MKTKHTLAGLTMIALSFISTAHAQWGYDPMAQADMIMQYYNQMDPMGQMNMLMQQANQQAAQAQQQMIAQFAQYYRQQTGDYNTPDMQAADKGFQLWCQNSPAECQAVITRGQQLQAQDAQGWAQTNAQIAQTNSEILDINQAGYMNRSNMQYQGQQNYVQGAIYGESNYYGQNGSVYSLPVYPDPNMSYTTPEGYPLAFDYQSNTWYQGDGYGYWTPLGTR